ncbi:MAG: iron uptake transporter permease EfeU [Acidimicrobiia bacterium]
MDAFLLMLREGVEAALIVGILLAYLSRLGRHDEKKWVWNGVWAAVLVSVVAGVIVFATIGSLEGRSEEMAEGVVAVAAAGLLTWMIFWMGRRARSIRLGLEAQVDEALAADSLRGLAVVAFVSVLREGLESALFLLSTTVGEASAVAKLVSGLAGIAAAAALGYLIYRGSHRLNIALFFRVTGILIVLFAAGLIAKAIHEFQEVGILGTTREHLWNLGVLDPETSLAGEFLSSLFGWSPSPSLEMIFGYLLFLVPTLLGFLAMTGNKPIRIETRTG